MKFHRSWALAVLALSGIVDASAQVAAPPAPTAAEAAAPQPAAEARPGTGDVAVDRLLADIDAYAARYRASFIDELVRYFDAPRPLIGDVLGDRKWAAGDVYYACALARVSGRPCRALLDAWAQDNAQGWAPIAARMGVAKGSPQARRLREGIAESYARWARPLPDAAGETRP
jgi:hypothetical protein